MKGIVRPSEVSPLVSISPPPHTLETSADTDHSFCVVSKNGLWMCLVRNTSINIFSTETGRWCGSHCFAESLQNPSAKITNVVEFSSSHIMFQCLLVSINQDHESQLCMFNVDTGKVVQSILIPEKISSIDVVSGDGGVCMETHYLNRRLRYMFGIVVIGTVDGHIYFLDLCLDESFSCDETAPNITIVLKQHEYSAQRREAAIAKNQHIFLRLNEESDRFEKFELQSRSKTLGRFSKNAVSVTAVKYFKSLTSVAVGFMFGGIQLWELHHLTLQFTISTDPHNQPIVNFAFQEPENDPRNFCYLWVFRGHSAIEDKQPETVSCASMYSMTFFKREFVKAFGALYTELQACTKRFEFPFTNDIYHSSLINPSMNSRLLFCQVINQKDLSHCSETLSGNESCEVSEEMSLCFITWEVWSHSGNFPSSCHFAIFDLNQWYQAQMPCSFRCDPSALSPYFGVFSLEEIKRVLGKEELLGVFTIPQSIKKFKSLAVSEEFFYPSSLGFQTICFSHHGLCKTTYFGYQKHLLFEMAELGPKVLLNPKEVFASLVKCGLVADIQVSVDRTPLVSQKEALLQLALEYHLPFFFIKCLKEWRYSDSVHEYCTSRALLNWAWKKVMVIKNAIDRLSLSLFNCSGVDIDKTALKSLYAFRRQLNLIDNIIAGYQKYVTPRTEQGIQDLLCRREAVSCINLYLKVLLWLRSVHVLPEVCEAEAAPENVVYRVEEINKSYSCRRSALQALNSSIGPTDVLLIDGMVKETGISSSWQEKGGSGFYPPPSIYAALSLYLSDGGVTEWKHALIYYLLLDLRNSTENTQFHSDIKMFPVIFGMPKYVMKLTKAFWYLDRKDCENAIRKLLDPAVKSNDVSLWHHQRIIKSFLYYRTPEKALKYVNHMMPPQSTLEDMRLYLSVLLSCGAVTQAFEYQRKKQTQSYGIDLMKHLFLGCQETGKMRELMYLPLNQLETSTLKQFLSESEDPSAQEALVIYHLLHCNFFEAERVNGKLSHSLMKKMSTSKEVSIKERTSDRNNLVECLLSGISKTEKCLVDEINRLPLETTRIEESLKPLSFSVKSNAMKKTTYSDFLRSLMTITPFSTPHSKSFFRSRTGSCLDDLPFLRPINTPERIKLPTVVRNNSIVNKRAILSTSPNEYASPAKRSRLLDNATFKETPNSRRNLPKHLVGDIISLLQTPPIHRKKSLITSNDNQGTPVSKPQSILKKSVSSVEDMRDDFHCAETPPLISEDQNTDEEDMQVDKVVEQVDNDNESQSKQIRFDVPYVDQSVSESAFIISEKSLADEDTYDCSLNSTPDKAQSSWKKSLSNLTREPLAEILKHSPPSNNDSTTLKNETQSKPNFKNVSQTVAGLKTSNLLFKSSIVRTDVDPDHSKTSTSTQCLGSFSDQIMTYSKDVSLPQSPARKYLTRSAIREISTPINQSKGETSLSSFVSGQEIIVSSEEKPEINPSYSENETSQVEESNTLTIAESDDEMFYSPCSTNSPVFDHMAEKLGKPTKLFEDISSETNREENIEEVKLPSIKTDNLSYKSSLKSIESIVFTKNVTSTTNAVSSSTNFSETQKYDSGFCVSDQTLDEKESNITNYPLETSVVSDNELKPSNREGEKESVETNKQLTQNVCSSIQLTEISPSVTNVKATRKTFVFSRSSSVKEDKSTAKNVNAEIEQEKNVLSETLSAKPSRKTFVFTRRITPQNTSVTSITNTDKTNDLTGTINMEYNTPDETLCEKKDTKLLQNTYILPGKETAKDTLDGHKNTIETFVFSKPFPEVSVDQGELQEEANIDSPKTFLFSKPLLPQDEIFTEPSHKTYSFSKTVPSDASETRNINISNLHSSEKLTDVDGFLVPSEVKRSTRKTYVFTSKSSNSSGNIEADIKVSDSPAIQSSDTSFTTAAESVIKDQKTKPSRKTFVFGRNIALNDTTLKISKNEIVGSSAVQSSDTSSARAVESVIEDQKIKLSRKTFVFGRSFPSNDSTQKISNNEIVGSSAVQSSDTSSATATELVIEDLKTKPSRKTFVFGHSSHPIYLTQTVSCDKSSNDTLLNIQAIEKQSSNVSEFLDPNEVASETIATSSLTHASVLSNEASGKTKFPDSLASQSSDTNSSIWSKPITIDQKSKPTRKTFVFGRNLTSDSSTKRGSNKNRDCSEKDMDIQRSDQADEKIDFLQAPEAETYEEFSSSLNKNTPFQKNEEIVKTLQSSPCASLNTEPFDESSTSSVTPQKAIKKGIQRSGTVSKKKKAKGKVAKKIEFSFAEPHSPATPDILEALSQTPEQPLPSFMFSPPLTRGRLRQKKLDETMGSSFSSVTSDVSFTAAKKPPMDPILEGIIQEKSLQTKRSVTKRSAAKPTATKRVPKKTKLQDSLLDVSDQSFLLQNQSRSFSSQKQAPASPRHSMVLRQTRSKPSDSSFL